MFRPEAFQRTDESNDAAFYRAPRFVYHIDEGAVKQVTALYRQYFSPHGDTLDLMSSWVSHFPEEMPLGRVAGLGMHAAELNANPRLSEGVVHDLNRDPALPFEDHVFDQAAICVSVDYLVQPLAVFDGLARVLRPGAPLVVTFSNRCFPTKAIKAWLRLDDEQRIAWVKGYFSRTGPWYRVHEQVFRPQHGDPLYAVIGYAGTPSG